MKLLRTVVLGVLFLVGVFLSSANTASIEIVYLPPMPFGPIPEGASVEVPGFIVILGSILLGVLATGLGVALEQSKLRWSTRTALKKAKKQEEEWAAANQDVSAMKEQVANANGETERLRTRLHETEAEIAKLKAPKPGASPPGSPSTGSASEPTKSPGPGGTSGRG